MLKLAGAGAVAPLVPAGCAKPTSGFFTDAERQALAALADAILPRDDKPGGAALGAVAYIEGLMTALEQPTPLIWAGGPFSGRQPYPDAEGQPSSDYPQNDFANFLPLDRVSKAAWQLALYGSDGLPNGGPNDAVLGKTVGLRDQMREGLARVLAAEPGPVETWLAGGQAPLLETFDIDPDFRDLLVNLVTQAAFAAPEYGGNPGGIGWSMIHFEGDSQPLGYSQYVASASTYAERPDAPLSTANPGPDPEPMDAETHALVTTIILGLGGKVFK